MKNYSVEFLLLLSYLPTAYKYSFLEGCLFLILEKFRSRDGKALKHLPSLVMSSSTLVGAPKERCYLQRVTEARAPVRCVWLSANSRGWIQTQTV